MEKEFSIFGEPKEGNFKKVTKLPDDSAIINHDGIQQIYDMKLNQWLFSNLDEIIDSCD